MTGKFDMDFSIYNSQELQKRIFQETHKFLDRLPFEQRNNMFSIAATSHSSPGMSRRKVVLPRGYLVPIPLEYKQLYKPEELNGLRIGGKYFLYEEPCEGVEMSTSIYECKHIIYEFGGIPLNSVIMKQLEGRTDMIFSLTREDCKNIGIKYEPKLQLFPINLRWKIYTEKNKTDFTPFDMGTYEPSPKDGTIHQMHVLLKDIEHMWGDVIKIPEKSIIDLKTFFKDLRFRFKNDRLQRKFPIVYNLLVNEKNMRKIDFEKKTMEFMLFFGASEGIKPEEFKNISIDDLIEVSWCHYEPMTHSIKQRGNNLNDYFESCFNVDDDWF